MKKLRPFLPIMAVGVVLLVLLGLVGFKLFQALSKRGEAVAQVETLQRDLRRLQNADPFPSRGNIDQVFSNAARAGSNLTNLLQEVTASNFDPPATEPAGFNRLLGEYLTRWYGLAMTNNVYVAQEMGYGFEQYVAGQLPRAEHIPNLMRQLLMTDHLVRILARANVSQIESVRRLQFEGAVDDSRGPAHGGFPGMMGFPGAMPGGMMGMMMGMRRGAEMPGEGLVGPIEKKGDAIYTEYPFEVSFIGSAEALRAILNEAARSPRTMVVTSVTVENLRAGEAGAAPGGMPGIGGFPGGMRGMGIPGGGEFARVGPSPGAAPGATIPYFREQRIAMGGRGESIRAVLRLNFVEFDSPDTPPASPPAAGREAGGAPEPAPADVAGTDLPGEEAASGFPGFTGAGFSDAQSGGAAGGLPPMEPPEEPPLEAEGAP